MGMRSASTQEQEILCTTEHPPNQSTPPRQELQQETGLHGADGLWPRHRNGPQQTMHDSMHVRTKLLRANSTALGTLLIAGTLSQAKRARRWLAGSANSSRQRLRTLAEQ